MLLVAALTAATARAEEPAAKNAPGDATAVATAPVPAATTTSPGELLHMQIDRLIGAGTPNYKALAAPVSSDAEFLRRVYLDLNGTIPTVVETREFLASAEPDKRAKLIDRLLASPAYARHMQHVFDLILMQRLPAKHISAADWQKYLRESFAQNKPWDQLVREILESDGTDPNLRAASRFYLDREAEVNHITRDLGRVFLGVNLECAQCHDHPQIEDYKQKDYYGLSAFLSRSFLFKAGNNPASFAEKAEGEVTFESVFEIRDKKSTGPKTTGPRLFDGPPIAEPKFEKGQEYKVKPEKDVRPVPQFSRRAQLGPLLVRSDNVRFKRAAANRLWSLMLGRGLIEPLEYDHSDNPPSHPALLDLLANEIANRKFDIKSFLREIALSQTYQRASARPESAPAVGEASFAQAVLKPLSPEQLAWAMLQASGVTDATRQGLGGKATEEAVAAAQAGFENTFVSLFGSEPGRVKRSFDASADQALFLANDSTVQGWLAPRPGNLTEWLAKLPPENTQAIADELYLSVLTRPPTSDEANEVRDYLAGRAGELPTALQELVWAVLTSAEFRFNH